VLANGFSCREQIEQLSGRKTRHIAEAIAEAMEIPVEPIPPASSAGAAALLAAGGAVAGSLLLRALTRRMPAPGPG
jgi:hypothetical protein